MAIQNTAESIQIKAAAAVFWAVKRYTRSSNSFCASATIQALEPYNLKCFDISEDQEEQYKAKQYAKCPESRSYYY